MARFAIIDTVVENATAFGAPLIAAGHQVSITIGEVDFTQLATFRPQIVVASLYRKRGRRPAVTPPPAITGYEMLCALQHERLFGQVACVVIGHGVDDQDLEAGLAFDLFLACQVDPRVGLPVAARVCHEKSADLMGPYIAARPVPNENEIEVVIRWGSAV
jgi:hypothetical protein